MAKKTSDLKYYEGVGRRKSAVARVRLYVAGKEKELTVGNLKLKNSDIFINSLPVSQYFSGEVAKKIYQTPLLLTENSDRFAISAHIRGGGISGQLDAFVLGLSRSLQEVDKNLRPLLKAHGLLTRDARVKERRKVGTGGKARRKKQSPKR